MLGVPDDFMTDARLQAIVSDLTADARLRALAEEVLHLRDAAGPRLQSMRFESGHFDAAVTGQAVEAISLAFVSHLKSEGAENFIELNVHDRDDPLERYTITVQRISGKSPGQLLGEANERIRLLEERKE